MRKLVALAVVVLFSSSVFAGSTFKDFTASVTFTGGETTFDASLQTGTSLTWDTTTITLNSSTDQWKPATAYISMTKTISQRNGVVYMYQDNKADAGTSGDAKYKAVNPRTEDTGTKYNGLVKGGSEGGENGYLPMSFKISTYTLTTPDMKGGAYGTRYITDTNDQSWVKDGYKLVASANGYIADVDGAGNPEAIVGSDKVSQGYMYIGANFLNIMSGDSFGSNHIKFEVVSE